MIKTYSTGWHIRSRSIQYYQCSFFLFIIRYISSGTPITDVTMPTGSTTGDNKVLAKVSANTSNTIPNKQLMGMRYRWSPPTRILPR